MIVNSVIGQRTVIRKGCHIQDSYVIGNDYYTQPSTDGKPPIPFEIGEDSLIKRAIIDKNVRIGKRVLLINQDNMRTYDSPNLYVRDGIIVVPANSNIPDDFCF
jgi:glucose-1-phosphate adenylyltransferase